MTTYLSKTNNPEACKPYSGVPLPPRWFVLLVVGLLLVSHPAAAENRAGDLTLTPFFGGQGFPFGGETHFDADYNYGFRAGYNFTPNIGTEFVWGYNKTVHDPEVAFCRIQQFGGDVLYFFQPEKKLVPFIALGFGVFTVNFDGTYDENPVPPHEYPTKDDTIAYFNFGAGVEYELTSWLGIRADYRDAIMLDSGDHAMQGGIGLRFKF